MRNASCLSHCSVQCSAGRAVQDASEGHTVADCMQVGLAVAYPIFQSGLFVAGLWGMVMFNELPGAPSRLRYVSWGLLLIGGGILLTSAQG
jgi:hypothetical protein